MVNTENNLETHGQPNLLVHIDYGQYYEHMYNVTYPLQPYSVAYIIYRHA